MNFLLTGVTGQLGWELRRCLMPLGQVIAPGRRTLDLSRPDTLPELLAEYAPNVVVNAAAYTAVEHAEREEKLATLVNGTAAGVLADICRARDILLIHYSTDYVFDGRKADPYLEGDPPAPLNAYGRSKLAGEIAVKASGCDYLIFRTSWIYSSRGRNFVLTMLKAAANRSVLRVVEDQVGAPTWARNLADATAQILPLAGIERREGRFASGTFHLCAAGSVSWFGFAKSVLEMAARREIIAAVPAVHAVKTQEYPTSAARSLNSRLAINRVQERFSLFMPRWEDALNLCLDEIAEKRNLQL